MQSQVNAYLQRQFLERDGDQVESSDVVDDAHAGQSGDKTTFC